jgi:hypothetical protein
MRIIGKVWKGRERGKDLECRERRSEESLDFDERVESENCWIWN